MFELEGVAYSNCTPVTSMWKPHKWEWQFLGVSGFGMSFCFGTFEWTSICQNYIRAPKIHSCPKLNHFLLRYDTNLSIIICILPWDTWINGKNRFWPVFRGVTKQLKPFRLRISKTLAPCYVKLTTKTNLKPRHLKHHLPSFSIRLDDECAAKPARTWTWVHGGGLGTQGWDATWSDTTSGRLWPNCRTVYVRIYIYIYTQQKLM